MDTSLVSNKVLFRYLIKELLVKKNTVTCTNKLKKIFLKKRFEMFVLNIFTGSK